MDRDWLGALQGRWRSGVANGQARLAALAARVDVSATREALQARALAWVAGIRDRSHRIGALLRARVERWRADGALDRPFARSHTLWRQATGALAQPWQALQAWMAARRARSDFPGLQALSTARGAADAPDPAGHVEIDTPAEPWPGDPAAPTREPSRWGRIRDWTIQHRQRLVVAFTLIAVFGAALIIVLPLVAFRQTITTNRVPPRVEAAPLPPRPAPAAPVPTDEQGARILSQGAPIVFDPFSPDMAPTTTGFTAPVTLAPPFTAVDAITLAHESSRYRLAHVHGLDRNAVCIDEAGLKFACGLQARASLQNQLTQRTLTCAPEFYPGELRYRCSNGEVDLAHHQVARGFAWPEALHLGAFTDALTTARTSALGAWRGGFVLYDTTQRVTVPASPLAAGDKP